MFSNSVSGMEASVNLFTLIETAKESNLDPYAYLKFIFTKLPTCQSVEDYEALLPFNLEMPDLVDHDTS